MGNFISSYFFLARRKLNLRRLHTVGCKSQRSEEIALEEQMLLDWYRDISLMLDFKKALPELVIKTFLEVMRFKRKSDEVERKTFDEHFCGEWIKKVFARKYDFQEEDSWHVPPPTKLKFWIFIIQNSLPFQSSIQTYTFWFDLWSFFFFKYPRTNKQQTVTWIVQSVALKGIGPYTDFVRFLHSEITPR